MEALLHAGPFYFHRTTALDTPPDARHFPLQSQPTRGCGASLLATGLHLIQTVASMTLRRGHLPRAPEPCAQMLGHPNEKNSHHGTYTRAAEAARTPTDSQEPAESVVPFTSN